MWSLAAKQTDDVPSIECAGASESDLVTFAQLKRGWDWRVCQAALPLA